MITKSLIRLFVKDSGSPEKPNVRLAYGMLAGWCGIIVNLLLCAVKFSVGMLSGSIAIAADAVNNLSDAGSSGITVFGFKLAAAPPDNEHPFGHGRLEYIAALIVAVVIVSVGLNFLKESVQRILNPEALLIDNTMLYILLGTLVFKLWLFFFFRCIGNRINSEMIRASAFDSLSDMLTTAVIAGAAFAGHFIPAFPIDGCVGAVVAVIVIAGGIKIIRDAVSPLLGECPDRTIVEQLRAKLLTCEGVRGVHDIILHNYGPNRYFATAHAEVSRDSDSATVHDILESAEIEVGRELPIFLVLHGDPFDTEDPTVKMWRARMEDAVLAFDPKFRLYDFHLHAEPGKPLLLSYHLLIPRNYALDESEITGRLTAVMTAYDPEIRLDITYLNAFV